MSESGDRSIRSYDITADVTKSVPLDADFQRHSWAQDGDDTTAGVTSSRPVLRTRNKTPSAVVRLYIQHQMTNDNTLHDRTVFGRPYDIVAIIIGRSRGIIDTHRDIVKQTLENTNFEQKDLTISTTSIKYTCTAEFDKVNHKIIIIIILIIYNVLQRYYFRHSDQMCSDRAHRGII